MHWQHFVSLSSFLCLLFLTTVAAAEVGTDSRSWTESDWHEQCAAVKTAAAANAKLRPRRNVTVADLTRVGETSLAKLIFDEEHKIILCPIQKVASSEWVKFFHHMMGRKNYQREAWHDDSSPRLDSLIKRKKYTPAELVRRVNDAFRDSEWTNAIFFRDPMRRLISVFLMMFGPDKNPLVGGNLFRYRKAFGLTDKWEASGPRSGVYRPQSASTPPAKSVSFLKFDDFIEQVTRDIEPKRNLHWKPQSEFCLSGDFIDTFNFVGNFEDISTHAELLFRCTGTFEKYARTGWGADGKAQLFGHKSNSAFHRTRSAEKYHDMATPELQKKVWKHFSNDYDMFRRILAPPFNISFIRMPPSNEG